MTVITDFIAAELALLERVVSTPVEPFGYGVDLSCVDDVTDTLEEVDAFGVLGIGQAITRRLSTQRGTLPDDPDYGHDVREYLNSCMTPEDVRDAQGAIRNEVTKDDRLDDATVTLTLTSFTLLRIEVVLTPADSALKPFVLTLAVTSGAVLMEAIG